MKINSLLRSIPGLKCIVKRSKFISFSFHFIYLYRIVEKNIVLIKFSSLSAPTKIELTAGSDEKTQLGESREFTRSSRCGFVAQWLERATSTQDLGFDSRRGCAVFFRLIRLSVLSLSVLKEKRI